MSELSRDEVAEVLGRVSDALAAEITPPGSTKRAWWRRGIGSYGTESPIPTTSRWNRERLHRTSISWSGRTGSWARAAAPSNRGETGLHDSLGSSFRPSRDSGGGPGSISMDSGLAFGAPPNDSETLCGLALMRGPNRSCSRRSPGLIGASGRRQVMVMTTAAAAATRMAMAAVSTVMEVAKVVISQSRRALNAPRWGGTVGIAGRNTIECPPQRKRAGNA